MNTFDTIWGDRPPTEAQERAHFERRPACVILDGPYPDQDPRDGEEIPVYSVTIADADGEPLDGKGNAYSVHDRAGALQLAENIARDRRLELVDDTTPE